MDLVFSVNIALLEMVKQTANLFVLELGILRILRNSQWSVAADLYLEVCLLKAWFLGQHPDQRLARHLAPVHLLHGLEVGMSRAHKTLLTHKRPIVSSHCSENRELAKNG